ncbi:hypothetical protein FUAX_24000 [Fulvitalea axinellae]|uniref:PspC domain-containing protein n=1 Tax=Fulvitalea axinellae TaxID=1182444 RepID=A0AAU9D202_9BACT|nr:hypothetical protein FUAX_24000 [Fulvitalea axinellae]
MKKNISISISGIIFHVEEDGYERLNRYLGSINRYFSSFEDSHEIIEDIENRIAEIFLSKLNKTKQVINREDVDDLITRMGSVEDFKAVGETPPVKDEDSPFAEDVYQGIEEEGRSRPASLCRDMKRKLLGGVFSGLGHYFNVDPLWFRLIFLLGLLGTSFNWPIMTPLLLAYVALWIALPPVFDLKSNDKHKKLFRDPDNKLLGGVSSGIASYFGIDPVIVRLVFVISLFLWLSGPVLYIILWIILPEANSITEKVQMKGDPVTLTNIEARIKKSLESDSLKNERISAGLGRFGRVASQIILVPIGFLKNFFKGIGDIFSPVLKVIFEMARFVFGTALGLFGLLGVVALVTVTGAYLGIFDSAVFFNGEDYPMSIIRASFPAWGVISIFFAILLPLVFVIMGSIVMLTKRISLKSGTVWSFVGLWALSLIGMGIFIPRTVMEFDDRSTKRISETIPFPNEGLLKLRLREVGYPEPMMADVRIKGYQGSDIQIMKEFTAQGRTRRGALENAEMAKYNVALEGDELYFDSNLTFVEGAKYAFQNVHTTIYIPVGKKFTVGENLVHLLRGNIDRRSNSQLTANTWAFGRDNQLLCVTCDASDNTRKTVKFRDFSELEVDGDISVVVERGVHCRMEIEGQSGQLEALDFEHNGERLTLDASSEQFRNAASSGGKLKVKVYVPSLEDVRALGKAEVLIYGVESKSFRINTHNRSDVEVEDIDCRYVEINSTELSSVTVSGSCDKLQVDASETAKVNALEMSSEVVYVVARISSKVSVNVSRFLKVFADGVSVVNFTGDVKEKKVETEGFAKLKHV